MNGSIIYEVDRPENTGLNRSIKILRKAKEGIDNVQKVSWADLIVVAGAEAVALCGGPEIPVRLGRLDSSTADPTGKLPEETLDATSLKTLFSKKGFSAQEMVVLSGAHTIGGKGLGSPIVFDNTYFKVLLEKPQTSSTGMAAMVGLRTDWALTEDDECLSTWLHGIRWAKKMLNVAYLKSADGSGSMQRTKLDFRRLQGCIHQARRQWSLVESGLIRTVYFSTMLMNFSSVPVSRLDHTSCTEILPKHKAFCLQKVNWKKGSILDSSNLYSPHQ
ncbi:putative L-ascorbate peroxidase 6 isoform X3 [Miscanthus floridulus]